MDSLRSNRLIQIQLDGLVNWRDDGRQKRMRQTNSFEARTWATATCSPCVSGICLCWRLWIAFVLHAAYALNFTATPQTHSVTCKMQWKQWYMTLINVIERARASNMHLGMKYVCARERERARGGNSSIQHLIDWQRKRLIDRSILLSLMSGVRNCECSAIATDKNNPVCFSLIAHLCVCVCVWLLIIYLISLQIDRRNHLSHQFTHQIIITA